MREYLFSMGGTSHPNDSAVFMWTKDSLIMSKEGLDGLGGVLAVHVDDFLWAGISEFKTKSSSRSNNASLSGKNPRESFSTQDCM